MYTIRNSMQGPNSMDEFLKKNITSVAGEVNQQTRIVINNIFNVLNEFKQDPQKLREVNFQQTRYLTASFCGVSIRTVDRIKQECKDGGVRAPRQRVNQPRPVTDIDDLERSVIKQIVTSHYSKGERPSVRNILNAAKEKIEGFKCSVTSMRRILKGLGYNYKTAPDGKKLLIERKSKKLKTDKEMLETSVSPEKHLYKCKTEPDVTNELLERRDSKLETDEGALETSVSTGEHFYKCKTEPDETKQLLERRDSKLETDEEMLEASVSPEKHLYKCKTEPDVTKQLLESRDSKLETDEEMLDASVSPEDHDFKCKTTATDGTKQLLERTHKKQETEEEMLEILPSPKEQQLLNNVVKRLKVVNSKSQKKSLQRKVKGLKTENKRLSEVEHKRKREVTFEVVECTFSDSGETEREVNSEIDKFADDSVPCTSNIKIEECSYNDSGETESEIKCEIDLFTDDSVPYCTSTVND